ncbi:MAG: hypothetical protein PF569_03020 [Candidatus Woesearchaeota archaeon]|jgi:hypothetical protein|nr:hypothetical protein [Candidatus Woesearchaeota archaeon]
MIKSKKGMSWEFLIGLIVLGVVLIISFNYVQEFITEGEYRSSVIGCKTFFEQIDGKPAFFNNSLNDVSPKLYTAISKICPSRDYEIEKNQISPAANLISDCWDKTGAGEDIFGAEVRDKGICLYCGKITAKDEIPNFKDQILKEFEKEEYSNLYSEQTGANNVNKLYFEKIPNSLDEDKSAAVFYYAYKPPYPAPDKNGEINFATFFDDVVLGKLSQVVGNLGAIGNYINYFTTTSSIDTYTGIIVTSQIEYDESKSIDDINNQIELYGCDVIIPEKNIK